MATRNDSPDTPLANPSREWNVFAYRGYARIVTRKHGLPVPEFDPNSLSDEELDRRMTLLRDLAHLPPG